MKTMFLRVEYPDNMFINATTVKSGILQALFWDKQDISVYEISKDVFLSDNKDNKGDDQ